jgi:4-hydroxymandelate synthase
MLIRTIDHLELYVADLEKSGALLSTSFGFAIAGHESDQAAAAGQRSLLLRQGHIALLLTTAGRPDHPAAQYLSRHGDGVAVIAFRTDDVQRAFAAALAHGAHPISSPTFTGEGSSRVGTASVTGIGDVVHKLVQRAAEHADFAPGVIDLTTQPAADHAGQLEALDHIAICLEAGSLDATVAYYESAFGLGQIYDERIEVGDQAILSKVVQDHDRNTTFTLIEPDLAGEPGQIAEFLRDHGGPGVQHLAFRTPSIATAIQTITQSGVEFLEAPAGYYTALPARLGALSLDIKTLRELNILADRDPWGEMFQIFTRSVHERRTLFYELIERRGARTFGSRNIRALYEALEDQRAAQRAAAIESLTG